MKQPVQLAAPLFAALTFAACSAGVSTGIPGTAAPSGGPTQSLGLETSSYQRLCADTRPGYMNCDVMLASSLAPGVAGLSPADLQAAYELPSTTKGVGQIVAIVDAFDNPNVASDLAKYRKNFDLGTASFTKYNELGEQKNYPSSCSVSSGWCVEIDLDVEMVSASCPKCKIWLFEANSDYNSDLYAAVAKAAKMGAHIISNSYSGGGGSASGGAFAKSGVTYLASAGDNGYGLADPADYRTVVSVGGTILTKRGSTYSEVVWPGSGAGCSFVAKPVWQHDPQCAERTGNDVSAVALNVAEYDSFHEAGWITVGGTSVSSPLLAGVYGLAGNARSRQSGKFFWTLSKKALNTDLRAIKKGRVSGCPPSLAGTYLCTAGTGQYKSYSAPSGWGTPKGIGAF